MTSALNEVRDDTETTSAADVVDIDVASWRARAGAFGVDVLFGAGLVATTALVWLSTAQGTWLFWVAVAVGALTILAIAVNRLLLPTITGWSLGRSLFGIRVVGRDGSPVSSWRLLARDFAHLLDTVALCIGWLWPLWDSRRRTFADLIVRTEVRRAQPPHRDVRRPVAIVLASLAVLAAASAGLSYAVVYRHDKAVDQAREQISTQGPGIVAEMLSYDPANLDADFQRAQSQATAGYREQLVAQQQAVQRATPVANEYWVTNNAVLSASPDRALMLLMMQGQRGVPPAERLITATVRAAFEKASDGQWQVADLIVLTKPTGGRQ